MVQDTPSRKLDQYIVRFPDGMRDRIKEAAAENGRSMNAEIIYRLETTLEMDSYIPRGNAGLPDHAREEPPEVDTSIAEKLLKEIETLNTRLAIIEALTGKADK